MIPFELVCGYSILPQNLRYGFFSLLLQLHFTFRGYLLLKKFVFLTYGENGYTVLLESVVCNV